jgi:hypothetical protein
MRVVWSHPAVLNGAPRVTEVTIDDGESTLREYVARNFLPFGIEGIDYLTIHHTS